MPTGEFPSVSEAVSQETINDYADLSGDYNPIHADPDAAAKAGFDRPILHGLCTMGIATRAILQTRSPGAPERLKSMFVRFSKPVFPGETIATEMYTLGEAIRFRCRAVERDVIVLDRGTAVLAPTGLAV